MKLKRVLFLFMLLLSIGAKAESLPTTDYVYTTGISYSSTQEKYYFDVALKGDDYYCAYGMEIRLPNGLSVEKKANGTPNISRQTAILPYEVVYDDDDNETKAYSHSVTSSFPSNENNFVRIACMSTSNEYFTKKEGNICRVYVQIDSSNGTWPIGAIKFQNVELNKVGQPYDSADREDIVLIHTGETNLPLSVSATAHWGTCILPFNAELPAGVKAYTCIENDEENIYLENASSMEAYTPYILYSEDGYKGTISGTVDAQKYPETGYVKKGLLNGAIVDQSISDGYILQNLSGGVMFYPIKEGSTFNIPAGKCWMTLHSTANAQGMNFVVNDPASIKNIGITDDDNSIYTLQGIKVENGVKGSIYIKSGKKFIAK